MSLCYLLEHQLIPQKEINRVFAESYSIGAELDSSFFCFDEPYQRAARVADENSIILDLGCAYAPQSYYFTHCKRYIGVDLPMPQPDPAVVQQYKLCGRQPEVRFQPDNAEFYIMSIQKFIGEVLPTLSLDMDNVIAICSAVPDEEARALVERTFPVYDVSYPGLPTHFTLPAPEKTLEEVLFCSDGQRLDINHAVFLGGANIAGSTEKRLCFELPLTAYPVLLQTYSAKCKLQLSLYPVADAPIAGNEPAQMLLNVTFRNRILNPVPIVLTADVNYTSNDIRMLCWLAKGNVTAYLDSSEEKELDDEPERD